MKTVRTISKEANQLRVEFQNLVINPFVKEHGSLKGYKGQIYILLPKFSKRLKLYKNVSVEIYNELRHYLLYNQSQRRFNNSFRFLNQLDTVKDFNNSDLSICFKRVWHNGSTARNGEHWKAQTLALRNNIEKFGFTYYRNDYNFYHHNEIESANPFLVKLYDRIINEKLGASND